MIRVARTRLRQWTERARLGRAAWHEIEPLEVSEGVLAIAPGGYIGVINATRRLFPTTLAVDGAALLFESDRRDLVDAVERVDAGQVVFSGWDDGYEAVARALRRTDSRRRLSVLWHGSPMQLADANERAQYARVVGLLREGVLDRAGFLKTGEGEAHAARGLSAVDVFNPPPPGPPASAERKSGRGGESLRLGLFAAGPSWRKNPYAMLAAVGRLDDAVLTGVLDRAAQAHARDLGLSLVDVRSEPFDAASLADRLRRQDCNLYVTLSECSPLLPLESLHLGVPCLIGANSHLFTETPIGTGGAVEEAARLLDECLVVPRADDPRAIAGAIRTAVAERSAILDAYATWVPAYADFARRSLEAYLAARPGTVS